jgi:PAS domain S-box-containing protein
VVAVSDADRNADDDAGGHGPDEELPQRLLPALDYTPKDPVVFEQPSTATVAYSLGTIGVAVLSGTIAVFAWRRRDVQAAMPLAALMAGVTVWTGCLALALLTTDRGLALVLSSFRLGASGLVAIGFLWVAAEIGGQDRLSDRRVVAVLSIEPVAITLLTATTDLHGLVYQSMDAGTQGFDAIEVTVGVGFWLHVGFAYVLLLIGLALTSVRVVQSAGVYRRQAATVLVGALIGIAGNLVVLVGSFPVDVEPIAFAVTGILIGWSIWRYRLMDLVPVAREQVIETLADPVIVLDEGGRITDCNAAANGLLGRTDTDLIGTDATEAFSTFEDGSEHILSSPGDDVVELAVGDELRHFEIRDTPILDDRNVERGRVLLFHDVSDREQSRRELERQNEQLERFASVVSHDLRNPLSVAEGYLPMARETGEDEHFDAIDESLDRMNAIIEDVLALARQGTRIEDRTAVQIEEVAKTAWEQVDTGDAELVVAADVTIGADRSRLQRLLENLFRNALEHGSDSNDADPLTVTVGTIGPDSPGSLQPAEEFGFYVADDGVGIPEADRERVFEAGHSSSSDGTGLGLSIVQGIAEAHGWSVRAMESGSGGARFEVTGAPPISHPESVALSPCSAQP